VAAVTHHQSPRVAVALGANRAMQFLDSACSVWASIRQAPSLTSASIAMRIRPRAEWPLRLSVTRSLR